VLLRADYSKIKIPRFGKVTKFSVDIEAVLSVEYHFRVSPSNYESIGFDT
jgi:hypothetical protein